MVSRVQKWRFIYKYSIVNYKDGISLFKMASRLTCDHGDISDEKIGDYKLISKELLSVFVEKIYLYQDKRVEIKLRYQDLINQCVIMLVSLREEETL